MGVAFDDLITEIQQKLDERSQYLINRFESKIKAGRSPSIAFDAEQHRRKVMEFNREFLEDPIRLFYIDRLVLFHTLNTKVYILDLNTLSPEDRLRWLSKCEQT